ncbi:MAG TPA: hypothetical protein VLA03_06355, partial [Draconibacterium sp.]|nr:hypothetical protein [Draconibacterium sp.]
MMNYKPFQAVLFLAIILFGCSKHSEIKKVEVDGVNNPVVSINGTWKITMTPPEKFWENAVNFTSWSDIQVPGECQMQGFAIKHDTPYAYKTRFEIPSDYDGKQI